MKNLKSRLFQQPSKKSSGSSSNDENPSSALVVAQGQTNLQDSQNKALDLWKSYKFYIQCTVGVIVFVLYNAFLIMAIIRKKNWTVNWCQGIKAILIITFISYGYLFYYKVIKVLIGRLIHNYFKMHGGVDLLKIIFKYPIIHLVCFAILASYAFFLSISSTQTFISFAGIWILLLLGFMFSKHHTKIHWRQVCWGLNLQFIIGLLFLHFQSLSQIYYCIMGKNRWIGKQVDSGASFVFGYLISGDFKSNEKVLIAKQNPIGAFQMFSDLLVFSMLVGILHHYKISNTIINYLSGVVICLLVVMPLNQTVAILSVFFGFKESIMFTRNYIPYISNAEFYSITVVGMATNSWSFVTKLFLSNKGSYSTHRVLADVLAIPSTLTMTRLLYPELDKAKLTGADVDYISNNVAVYNNIGESIVRHIFDAIRLSGAIIATGIVFAVFPYMLDDLIEWFAIMAGLKINLTWLLANLLTPFVYIVGIEWGECFKVATAVATKILYEESQAFNLLTEKSLSTRSQALAIYLLNDTANIIHLAFNIATISILVPSRLPNFVDVLARSFFTALLTSWLTACITGCLMSFSDKTEPFELGVV
uniref:Uncharacterized protein n=1 Tax=Strigamia maritima TaxID=126957 RepID=T1IX30_STRMM